MVYKFKVIDSKLKRHGFRVNTFINYLTLADYDRNYCTIYLSFIVHCVYCVPSATEYMNNKFHAIAPFTFCLGSQAISRFYLLSVKVSV